MYVIGMAPDTSPRIGTRIAKLVRFKLTVPYHRTKMEELARILKAEVSEINYEITEKGCIYIYLSTVVHKALKRIPNMH
jgi:hypothetical protein